MNDVTQIMNLQAAWQKTRVRFSWPDKIKQAELLRDAYMKLRAAKSSRPTANKTRTA